MAKPKGISVQQLQETKIYDHLFSISHFIFTPLANPVLCVLLQYIAISAISHAFQTIQMAHHWVSPGFYTNVLSDWVTLPASLPTSRVLTGSASTQSPETFSSNQLEPAGPLCEIHQHNPGCDIILPSLPPAPHSWTPVLSSAHP